jgi:hypothetical protein
MSLDLNDLLRDWPHEPGQLKVRKITGTDGREKLQLRIDLGLIQMETRGRPDGKSPHDCESLFEYYKGKLRRAEKKSEAWTLGADEIGDLQQEGIQYYHRYISFFQIGEYEPVIRDTQRNLEMFEFVARHAEAEELAEAVVQFTPYVLMMNTRARASIELDRSDYPAAIQEVERGIERIRQFYEAHANAEAIEGSPELGFLREWLEEIRGKQPVSRLEKMEREMEKAINAERYERAAELRDAIRAHRQRKERKSGPA